MARALYRFDPVSEESTLVATFEMDGKKLQVEWEAKTDRIRTDVEDNGIVVGGEVLFPKDGQAFYDALPGAYSTSSLLYISEE